jgi:hypothetical protein
MLESILRDGFALANRRLGLIFLDILWKAVWLFATAAGLLLVAAWFGGELGAIGWEDTGDPRINGLLVTVLLRDFWEAHRAGVLFSVAAVLFASAICWFLLEAFFRRRIVRTLAAMRCAETPGLRPNRTSDGDLNVFLGSGVVKSALLATAAAVLIPVLMAGAAIIAVVIFLALAFFLTIIDTLLRSDAVELFGTDLIRVTGLIGILLLFESMIDGALVVMILTGFLNAARMTDGLIMLGAAASATVFLTLLHSYLLLVRFSAVDIMRQNVVEV